MKRFLLRIFFHAIFAVILCAVTFEFVDLPFRSSSSEGIDLTPRRTYNYTDILDESPKEHIQVAYNDIGTLGPDFSAIEKQKERWLFLGSSTTQSIYLKPENSWPALVSNKPEDIWWTNAGIDGGSIAEWLSSLKQLHAVNPTKVFLLANPFAHKQHKHPLIATNEYKFTPKFWSAIVLPAFKMLVNKYRVIPVGHQLGFEWTNLSENCDLGFNNYYVTQSADSLFQEFISFCQDSIAADLVVISHPTAFRTGPDCYLGDNEHKNLVLQHQSNDEYLRRQSLEKQFHFISGFEYPLDTTDVYDSNHFNRLGSSKFANFIRSQLGYVQ